MIHEIRLYGDPVLRQPAASVAEFDARLRVLADDLLATQEQAGAVGLAAVQIGVGLSVFSIDGTRIQRQGRREVLVNPELVSQSGEIIDEEGCLSFPGIFARIVRPSRVAIRAQDLTGKTLEREADGFLARAYLHEIDHLSGRLFIDCMDSNARADVVTKMHSMHANRALQRGAFPLAPSRAEGPAREDGP